MNSQNELYGECPQLTADEEYAAWKAGDWDLLARSQLPWALCLAKRVCARRRFRDFDVAISAANLALAKSLRSFDPRLGRLTTWIARPVTWAVSHAIDDERVGLGPSKRLRESKGIVRKRMPENIAVKSSEPAIDREYNLNRSVARLPPQHKSVLQMRIDGVTLQKIGESMGVSKERARQIESAAVAMLRRRAKKYMDT